ncbi:MAG: N-formylglutamate amidohydrolase [Bacteriovoracaceae bacterium]|nr:N-formylglutamate amidohydrolase [Bacteriovoracaceae bacterium]
MFENEVFKCNEVYDFFPPLGEVKGILSIPHAGEVIPDEFLSYLTDDARAMMEDVDYRVHQLVDIERITNAGIAVIVANVHRYCVDLNRAPEAAVLNWKENSKGIPIVISGPTSATSRKLVEKYHSSYYNCLKEVVEVVFENINRTVPFIDLHSMPSRPTEYHLKLNPDQKVDRADFCVSNLKDNSSCTSAYIDFVIDKLKVSGYNPVINEPYFGGFVTKYINQFDTNNIQIEINRRIYMDEEEKVLTAKKVEILLPILTDTVIKTITSF